MWYLSFSFWLTLLSVIISGSIHVAVNSIILFFFFMAEEYAIVCMYHNFIHSSVNGCLCCLHVLSLVNSAAMNVEEHVSFWIIVLFRYMPRSGLLVFWVTSILFSMMAVPIYFPTNGVGGFSFLYILSCIFVICRLLRDDHSDQCEMVPHCSFDLHFSDN